MTPTDPPPEEPAPPSDPIRLALGALVASCYAGYRRAKQVAPGPAQPAGEADDTAADPTPPAEDGTSPPDSPKAGPAR
jgi:hypothetical protein